MPDYGKVIEELKKEVDRRYKGKAIRRHILSVARFALEIAEGYAKDDEILRGKVHIAALAHDLFKKFPKQDLREYIRAEQVPIDEFCWQSGGGLLHAPAAAHFLQKVFGISDEQIISAVYYHTTGRAGASVPEKIIFCADYLDPSREIRDNEPDVAELSERAKSKLDETYREIVRRKIVYTLGKGKPIHPNAIDAWNEIAAG